MCHTIQNTISRQYRDGQDFPPTARADRLRHGPGAGQIHRVPEAGEQDPEGSTPEADSHHDQRTRDALEVWEATRPGDPRADHDRLAIDVSAMGARGEREQSEAHESEGR